MNQNEIAPFRVYRRGVVLYKTYIVTKLYIKLHKMLFFVHITVHIMRAGEMKKMLRCDCNRAFRLPKRVFKSRVAVHSGVFAILSVIY